MPKDLRPQVLETFHDRIGHWDSTTSRQFFVDRYWCPGVAADIFSHVKTCKGCQLAQPAPKYRTTLRMPITGLFDTFSIDFAGPFNPGSGSQGCETAFL